MGLLQKIGGRKFIMAMIAGGFASFLEMHSDKGLSPTMAGFLIALVGTFSTVNHLATSSYEKSKADGGTGTDLTDLVSKVDNLTQIASNGDKESVNQLANLLIGINESVAQVQATAGQVGVGMLNMNKEIQQIKRAVAQPTF